MDLRLKNHRKQYFIVISYAASRDYCASAPHVHGQEIFKTLFQIPNHERDVDITITVLFIPAMPVKNNREK